MKKITLLFSFLVLAATTYGKAVPVNTAKTVGFNCLLQKGVANLTTQNDISLVYTYGNPNALFYVFGNQKCFVLVAADDAVLPILGYSKERGFKFDNLPTNVSGWLENYGNQIDFVIKNQIAATSDITAKWTNLFNNTKDKNAARTTSVSPLLTTIWNQSPYYNYDCPYDYSAGDRTVTGCVATATAQVMKFWNWPANGVGMHSYSTSSYGTLSADFGSTTYNWTAMPNEVTSTNPSVATLLYHVGVAVDMNYGPASTGGSGAYVIIHGCPVTNNAEYALKTYFNYDPSMHGENRASYSDGTWISMLEADLDAGHPIIYDGHGTSGGHCFVFDGYDVSNNFHVNWGWDGSDDGYFAIDALNPGTLGIGGGAGGFNSGQQAIFGVKPVTTTTTPSLALYDYVYFSASVINYGAAFTILSNVYNTGTSTFTGDFCAAAFDSATGTFITMIDSVMGTSLPSSYSTGTLTFSAASGLLAMLPGAYSIGIFYRPTGGSWVAVPDNPPYYNFEPMNVVNHNYLELAAAMSPAPFVLGSPASVTLNVGNYGSSTFIGSLDLSLYNLDGSFNSNIQTMTGLSLASGFMFSSLLTFSTSSITAAPGTYLLAVEFNDGTGWYLCGADYYSNPIYVTVTAPAPTPDIYEVNNTAGTAYNLSSTLTWVSGSSHTGTPGSNFHIGTDQDYYKVVLPAGYNYDITARVNDIVSTDDGLTYTVDAVWSYSTDGGTTWSSVYNDVMPGVIHLGSLAGGTVIFHCSPAFAGNIGTYLFKIGNITRTTSTLNLQNVDLSAARIYPNPAKNFVTIDLTNTNTIATNINIMDIQGRIVYNNNIINNGINEISVSDFADGMYFVEINTEAGILRDKFVVKK